MIVVIAMDEPAACGRLAAALGEGGRHRVLPAGNPEALERLAEELDDLDVLVFSAGFGGLGGREMRDRLRREFPGMQAVEAGGAAVEEVKAWLEQAEAARMGSGLEELGDYLVMEKRRTLPWTDTFRAVQRSVNREVVLERLKPEFAGDAESVAAFRAMVRARAAVTNPLIAAVYEVQDSGGTVFYTRELMRGRTPGEMAAAGEVRPASEVASVFTAVAEALGWLKSHGIAREVFQPGHVYLSGDGTVRVANLAVAALPQAPDEAGEIRALASAMLPLTDETAGGTSALLALLRRVKMAGVPEGASWVQLAAQLRRMRMEPAEGRQAEAVPRTRPVWLVPTALLGMAGLVAAVVHFQSRRVDSVPEVRPPAGMVRIPAGKYLRGEGVEAVLPEYWIDRHEVPLSVYAAFLEALAGGDPGRFDHPEQPAGKAGHEPAGWPDILAAAQGGRSWRGGRLTMNSPVFGVDWWDAWACARWMGRRLPAAAEWERAARGKDGRRYPWGNDANPGRLVAGAAAEAGGAGDAQEGSYWREVDRLDGDVSPDGVAGLAGNVAEWVEDWEPHPELPDERVPVFLGGDFRQTRTVPVHTRWLAESAEYSQPFLGFRTASSEPPDSNP
ncbi:MAG: hypothetical protein RLZZ179_2247 [Verrucomicrobiota bacterium]|jgi:formylglycine-generating enzyme required for sulfatase activity/CheY-like chemotaxis protein